MPEALSSFMWAMWPVRLPSHHRASGLHSGLFWPSWVGVRAPKFENNIRLFALCDCPLELTEHHPVRIILQEIRFFHGNQLKSVPFQFCDDALLDGQQACQPV